MLEKSPQIGKWTRKRKKCKRRKHPMMESELNLLTEASRGPWDVLDVRELMYRNIKSDTAGGEQMELLRSGLTSSVLDALLSPLCLRLLSRYNAPLLLELNRKLHSLALKIKRMRIGRLLNDCTPRHLRQKFSRLIANPLTQRQLYAFVSRVYAFLFRDVELLGQLNMQCLCSNIARAFGELRHRGCVLTRQELCKGIRFNRIRWLDGMHFKLKEAIVHNLLKYLINLFIHLFTSSFYSTINYAGKIVHYRRDIWRRICLEGFDLLRAERKLQLLELDQSTSTEKQIHRLRFIPKQRSIRPIVTLRDPLVKRWLAEVRAVLHFVMEQQMKFYGWGISSIRVFHNKYRRFLLCHLHQSEKEKVHFCTADLQNCYTSLDHGILERFIKRAISPERFTVIRIQATSKLFNYRTVKIAAGHSSANAYARLRRKRTEEFSSNRTNVEITGAEILERIQRFAMRTVISSVYNTTERFFVSGRGIAQGSQISTYLCNLYLGSMELSIFPNKPQKVFCARYMDDYVMMAYQREHIEQLVSGLLSGCPEFGLQFGKIVTSFRSDKYGNNVRWLRPKEKVQWCGLALNSRTLSMSIDYRRYRHRRPTCALPRSIHPSQHLRLICSAAKRVLKGRLDVLRVSASVWPAKRRIALKRGFCRFAFSHYFRHFCLQLALDSRDLFIRTFLKQLIRWIFNGFRKRSLPDQVSSTIPI